MIERISRSKIESAGKGNNSLIDPGRCVFLDLEHYIYHKPICIGIFGAARIEGDELISTQYFLENSRELEALVKKSLRFLMDKKEQGYDHLVAFAAKNDLMVLQAMFARYRITAPLREIFQVADLQQEFKKTYHAAIGLGALEKLVGITRTSPDISGSTIAKSFARIMADPGHIKRMPQEKIERLLDYNKADVENLYHILDKWESIQEEDLAELLAERERKRLALVSDLADENKE